MAIGDGMCCAIYGSSLDHCWPFELAASGSMRGLDKLNRRYPSDAVVHGTHPHQYVRTRAVQPAIQASEFLLLRIIPPSSRKDPFWEPDDPGCPPFWISGRARGSGRPRASHARHAALAGHPVSMGLALCACCVVMQSKHAPQSEATRWRRPRKEHDRSEEEHRKMGEPTRVLRPHS